MTQADGVVDGDGAGAGERLDQQPDRRLVVLRGLDRVLHHLLAVFDVVDRDDGHAGADAGVERRTVPAHFADAAGLVEVDAERINEAGAAASVLRLRLFVGVGFVAVDQLPATGLDRSEEHTSELPSLMRISYAVFCLKTKNN